MKLLHLTQYFFPEYSGTTTRLYNIVSRLPFNVQILASNRTVKGAIIAEKEEQFGNVKVNRIPLVPGGTIQSVPILRYFHTLYRRPQVLTNFASSQQFDIIHAHNSLVFGEAAKELGKTFNKPFILELHGPPAESATRALDYTKSWYIKRIDGKLLRYCQHAISLTESEKKWIIDSYKLPESKITVVPNGADVDQFSPKDEFKKEAENLREKLGLPGKVVMYAGVIDYINGMDDIAIVIPQIIKEKPDISFVFIGDGPEQKRLLSLSKSYPRNIKCLRQVPYSEMSVYYQMCVIFVIPRPSTISTETVTPLKLLEVMAAEKPVLGSNVGGIAEVIRHGENGYLFQKGNLTNLKNTLLEILDTDNILVAKNARKTVIQNYTWENSARILQKVYQDLV